MQPYDLIVIGSGPGGQRAAIQAVKAGKRVAMVEKQTTVGGVCINTGTIPSKTMREAVLHLSGFYDQEFLRRELSRQRSASPWRDLNFRVQRVIENEVARDSGPAEAQRRGPVPRHGQVHRSASHPRGEQQRLQRTRSANSSSSPPAPSRPRIRKCRSTAATLLTAIRS